MSCGVTLKIAFNFLKISNIEISNVFYQLH